MTTVNLIILIVAALAIIAILGMRSGQRRDPTHRDIVRRDESDDA